MDLYDQVKKQWQIWAVRSGEDLDLRLNGQPTFATVFSPDRIDPCGHLRYFMKTVYHIFWFITKKFLIATVFATPNDNFLITVRRTPG